MTHPVTPTLRLNTGRAHASIERWQDFSPPAPKAANDDPGKPQEPDPCVTLATFPDAILLTIEGDDDLAAEWRRLYPLHQRAQAEDAAYQLAEFYGLPLRSDDCTDVEVIRG